MTDIPHEDLISAYLDGELSPQEQQQVEELLTINAQARALLDELRAMRQALQSLPRRSVGADLAPAVLRRAERAMLARKPAAHVIPPSQTVSPPTQPTQRTLRLPGTSWRSWGWAGAAIAAALLLTILLPPADNNQEDQRQVARGPSGAGRDAVMSERADEPALSARESRFDAERKDVDSSGGIAPPLVMEKGAPRGAVESPSSGSRDSRSTTNADIASKGQSAALKAARDGAAQPAAEPQPETLVEGKGGLGGARPGQKGGPRAPHAAPAPGVPPTAQLVEDGIVADEVDAEQLLVVQVDVAPQAVLEGTFDTLLRQQNIVLESDSDAEPEANVAQTYSNLAQQVLRQKTVKVPQAQSEVEPADRDWVYVEASAAQIDATLAELNAQTSNYTAVAIEPAPGVASQAPLARYNRVVPEETRQWAVRELQNRLAGDKELQQRFAVDKLGKQGQQRAAPADADRPQPAKPSAQAKEQNDNKQDDLRKSKGPAAPPAAGKPHESQEAAKAVAARPQAGQAAGLQQNNYGRALRLRAPADAPADQLADQDRQSGRQQTSGASPDPRRAADNAAQATFGQVQTKRAEVLANRRRLASQAPVDADEMLRVLFVFRLAEQSLQVPATAATGSPTASQQPAAESPAARQQEAPPQNPPQQRDE